MEIPGSSLLDTLNVRIMTVCNIFDTVIQDDKNVRECQAVCSIAGISRRSTFHTDAELKHELTTGQFQEVQGRRVCRAIGINDQATMIPTLGYCHLL